MLIDPEKRLANRLRLRCDATIHRLGPSIDRGGSFGGTVMNVSGAGLKISSREMIPAGERIEVAVLPPLPGAQPVRITARVIWSRRNPDILLDWYTCGAAFEPASQASAQSLRDLLTRNGTPTGPDPSSPGATDLATAG